MCMKLKTLVKEIFSYNQTKILAQKKFEEYQTKCSFQLSRSERDSFEDGFLEGYESAIKGEK